MNIKYNEVEKTIEINDGLKTHHLMIKALLIITLINAVLNLLDLVKTGLGFMEIIWIILGIISIVALYTLFIKESGLEKIAVQNIIGLQDKIKYSKKQYYFKLTNGRTRALREVKTETDLNALRKLLTKAGIAN